MFELPTVDYPTEDHKDLPDGFRTRPYAGESDVPIIVELDNREYEFDGVPERDSVEEAIARYHHPSERFDPARDVTIAEINGKPVAFAQRGWVDTTDGIYREHRTDGSVLPEWRRHGIGSALLNESIRLSRDLAATHQTDRQRALGSWTNDRQDGAIGLMRKMGFQEVRWFFEMKRDLAEPIPDVPMPDGLETRPVTMDGIRQVWDADVEAFMDHWGGFDGSDENLKRWMDQPTFDPTLWVIAYDGDEVAGGVINGIHPHENEALGINRGWLHSVFTRRAWRRRGLARALIARSLVLLKERGIEEGALGVDADNPTGALGLYENIGFVTFERSTAWRKPMDVPEAG